MGSFTDFRRVLDVFHLFSLRLFTTNRQDFTHRSRGLDYKWTKGAEGRRWIS
jgi:hypothetical protein